MAIEMTLGTRPYKEMNEEIRAAIADGETSFILNDALGQRYIGCGAPAGVDFAIHGTPGNDLSAYMDGASIEIFGNGQDQMGNTMNDGTIIVHGHVGDAAGYAMRGGEIFIRDYCGWRVGIHMKQYKQKRPVVVIGGDAGSFLGEYMAGGIIICLGKPKRYLATGMHGGVLYLRDGIDEAEVGTGLLQKECDAEDEALIRSYLQRYNQYFGAEVEPLAIDEIKFTKLVPASSRPYGNMYVRA